MQTDGHLRKARFLGNIVIQCEARNRVILEVCLEYKGQQSQGYCLGKSDPTNGEQHDKWVMQLRHSRMSQAVFRPGTIELSFGAWLFIRMNTLGHGSPYRRGQTFRSFSDHILKQWKSSPPEMRYVLKKEWAASRFIWNLNS